MIWLKFNIWETLSCLVFLSFWKKLKNQFLNSILVNYSIEKSLQTRFSTFFLEIDFSHDFFILTKEFSFDRNKIKIYSFFTPTTFFPTYQENLMIVYLTFQAQKSLVFIFTYFLFLLAKKVICLVYAYPKIIADKPKLAPSPDWPNAPKIQNALEFGKINYYLSPLTLFGKT